MKWGCEGGGARLSCGWAYSTDCGSASPSELGSKVDSLRFCDFEFRCRTCAGDPHSTHVSLSLSLATSSTTLPDNNTAKIPRNEDCDRLAAITPLTGYGSNVSDNFDDIEVTTSISQSSSVISIR